MRLWSAESGVCHPMDVKRIAIAAGVVALVVVLIVGLSQAGGGGTMGSAPKRDEVAKELAGSPAPLAKLHSQANQLLPGGADAFKARMKELRGHPVVVNKWASWCGPCRVEFPDFQELSAKYGKRVAFLGVDGNDNHGDALSFLKDHPVSYPSYEDPDGDIARILNVTVAFPSTVFYDRSGKLSYLKQGQYLKREDLERDIQRYALRPAG
jgi:cytochrome c biogenesis protein CcmG/thiol:disulfide interchange protein DsbE